MYKTRTICVFNGDMSRGGGTERMTATLANCLANDRKFRVHVVSMNNGETPYFALSPDIKYHYFGKKFLGKIGMINKFFEVKKLVSEIRADILVNVDVFLSLYTVPLKLFYPKLKVITWEMFNSQNNIGLKWCHSLRQISLKYSDSYICQTKADAESFKKLYHHTENVTYVYNPYEPSEEYMGYDVNSKIIITAGHFFYTKGYDLAVEVAKLVLPSHPEWRWYFYGDGAEMENVKNNVATNNLSDQIVFAGRTKNIIERYKESAIYVMTSRTEGFGLVLLEAKCCNLPTVAFDVPFGPAEIIDEQSGGILIPAFDVELMAVRITELIENDELRLLYSNRARNNIDKFSMTKFAAEWSAIIDSI